MKFTREDKTAKSPTNCCHVLQVRTLVSVACSASAALFRCQLRSPEEAGALAPMAFAATLSSSTITFRRCTYASRVSHSRPRSFLPIQATSAVAAETDAGVQQKNCSDAGLSLDTSSGFDILACPICYEPLLRKGPPGVNWQAIYRSGFKCQKCLKTFTSKDAYLDLTVIAGTKNYSEFRPARTELFSSVSFCLFLKCTVASLVMQFKMAQEYFKPAAGGLLVDVSCGSGLFSRKFAKSGIYSGVMALDFSENMLRQCYDFITKDGKLSSTNLALVRADVSRLPFSSGSVDAVHAGAALHCWPSPSTAVAEICRILRSGGVFVATTFLASDFNTSLPPVLRTFRQLSNSYSFLTEAEIEDLVRSCGLINYTSKVQQSFIMFSAEKP
ncbi:hypothetical protein ACLOJK_002519 [Asimina triloba]